ncbi:hypothetical protein M758_4G267400, partial [Ceratodon purpureus]
TLIPAGESGGDDTNDEGVHDSREHGALKVADRLAVDPVATMCIDHDGRQLWLSRRKEAWRRPGANLWAGRYADAAGAVVKGSSSAGVLFCHPEL